MKKILLLFSIIIFSLFSEERAIKLEDYTKDNRVALIIGNSDYLYNPLKNPTNDAMDMAKELEKLDFDVTLKLNANRKEMAAAIKDFGKKIKNGGVALFYFAGHGVQVDGINYLIPISASISNELDVEFESIEARRILAEMENAGNKMNIIILDSCRNNPFESASRSGNFGLARMDAPQGSMLVYSTSPGKTAFDGGEERNGIFTGALLFELRNNPTSNLSELLIKVRNRVIDKTNGEQIPWESSSLTGQFFFEASTMQSEKGKEEISISFEEYKNTESDLKKLIESKAEYRTLLEKEYVSIIELENSSYVTNTEKIALWNDFLKRFPSDNTYFDKAQKRIIDLEKDKNNEVSKETIYNNEYILFEEFENNNNNWAIAFEDKYTLDVSYGSYYIYDEDRFRKTWKKNLLYDNIDFELSTIIRYLGGVENNGMNVIFGMDNGGENYYSFGVTANGYYSLYLYKNERWNVIIPWTKSSFVNSYENEISIIKEFGQLFFYVNGNFLDKLFDFEWFGPSVGFGINPGIEVEVEDLYITRRKDDSFEIFKDDFFDNYNNWVTYDYGSSYLKIEDSSYKIYNQDSFQKVWRRNALNKNDYYMVEVNLQKEFGPDNKGMNIIFNGDNEANSFLAFGISGDGQYILSKYEGGWSDLLPWTRSKYINKYNSINNIKIIKIYDTYYFFINGHYVDHMNGIYEWYGDSVGFGINSEIKGKINSFKISGFNKEPITYTRNSIVAIEDNFDNNKNQWKEKEGENYSYFSEGSYYFYNQSAFDKQFLYNGVTFMDEDFILEGNIKKGKGRDNNVLGLVFNVSLDGNSYYIFGYSNNGNYALFEYNNQWTTLIPWTNSTSIKINDYNKLKVLREGDRLDLYINDTYVNSFENYISNGIDFGFGMASDIELIIDDFKLTKINRFF